MRKCLHAARFLLPVACIVPIITGVAQGDPSQNTKSASRPASPPRAVATPAAPRPHPSGSRIAPAIQPTNTHGVPSDVKLADYRGKWVIMEFWSVGCGPCVRDSLPRLMKFYDRHQDQRSRFEVLTVHGPNGTSFSNVEKALGKISAKQWKGRALPFPIIFDETAMTLVNWGVEYLPAQFLVDPDGYLVATGPDACERMLEKALQADRAVTLAK